jgi:hypothetical protein
MMDKPPKFSNSEVRKPLKKAGFIKKSQPL